MASALIDAVFAKRPTQTHARPRPSEDFCRHLGIDSERPDRWRILPRSTQYTMTEFISDCRTPETDALERIASGCESTFPATNRSRAQVLLDAAEALRGAGAEALQDVRDRSPVFVRKMLAGVAGAESEHARWVLMFCATDRFVLGDRSVRRFVASAPGRASVAGKEAEALLRHCAHELAVSPRYLDYRVHVAFGETLPSGGVVYTRDSTGGSPPLEEGLSIGVRTHCGVAAANEEEGSTFTWEKKAMRRDITIAIVSGAVVAVVGFATAQSLELFKKELDKADWAEIAKIITHDEGFQREVLRAMEASESFKGPAGEKGEPGLAESQGPS